MVITPRVARSADSPNALRRLARFSIAGMRGGVAADGWVS